MVYVKYLVLNVSPLKTHLNGTLPALVVTFKEHVPAVTVFLYFCVFRGVGP